MTLNIDVSMALTIGVLVVLGKLYKEIVQERTLFKRKLSKLTPVVLLVVGEVVQIVYSINGNVLDGILKGVICTAIACWGYDAFKFLWSKGVK